MNYYYGDKHSKSYFEGWYLKCQTIEGKCLALIPAIHMDGEGCRCASIQVITEKRSWWLEYPGHSFSAQTRLFRVQIGSNIFSEPGMWLNIHEEGIDLEGRVIFGPFRRLKYSIMGPFQVFPNMECAHGVISMKHTLKGQLLLNGEQYDFDGGIGYIESDRGHSFPSTYLWAQDVWDEGSFMLSVAQIPCGKWNFTGCICSILMDGREQRIATYLGARIKHWSSHGAVIQQGRYLLKVETTKKQAYPLKAPAVGKMTRTIHESVCSEMRIRLLNGKKVLLDRVTRHAGFECADSK